MLKKLNKEGKFKLTEKSKDISGSYDEKSDDSLKSAKILYKNNLLENSISMSYYAMYNKVLSLFYLSGIKSENHHLSIVILREFFGFDTRNLEFAKTQRINKQYYVKTKVNPEEANKLIRISEDFIEELDSFMERLTTRDIQNIRNKIEQTINQ